MLPLLALTLFIYYTALVLWLELENHFLIKTRVHEKSDHEISRMLDNGDIPVDHLVSEQGVGPKEVSRHFSAISNEYLPPVNRRIKFLGVIISIGPLMGLLGTVTGMLSTFDGMIQGQGEKFENVVMGISEALITTQTGLIISIPAMAIIALIIQRRNRLRRCIARLERYNTRLVLRFGCPVLPVAQSNTPINSEAPAH